ncbi:tyrosine recombinase XerC [Spirochaetia bacterium]|nr:tyrosine recombinase XerC [Spirochaetia bacterium]
MKTLGKTFNKPLTREYTRCYNKYLADKKGMVTNQGYYTVRKTTYRMLRWFDKKELPLNEISNHHAQQYINHLSNRVKKDGSNALTTGTINNQIKAGKAFFKYLTEIRVCRNNPFNEIKYYKLADHISRNTLNNEQMAHLFDTLIHFYDERTLTKRRKLYRLHVVCEFLYATGLRISEAGNLMPDDIDLAKRIVYVERGKGDKKRIALITPFVADLMAYYLNLGRDQLYINYKRNYGDKVFKIHPERLMAVINRDLKTLCLELNLPVITTHSFRHSLGTNLLKAGCDIRYIQAFLGHDSLQTSRIYTRIDIDDLKDVLDRFHPRSGVPA